MAITLYASDKLDPGSIAAALREEGLEVRADAFTQATSSKSRPDPSVQEFVLALQEQGFVSVGEKVERLRQAIGTGPRLLLCIPQPTLSAHKEILACGASEIITPQTWTPSHIADRILAQFFLDGKVQPSSCGPLLGATLVMRRLYEDIRKLAPLAEPILILGETGTGKELVAREIHDLSGRSGPFIPINCAELNPELIGSELFGHKRGAFTGAMQDRKGLLVEAGPGTAFLDEIGELDFQSQAKLLRVIEDSKVRPVGANHWEDIRARIVLATNRDLEEECMRGKFRPDLYERICGFIIQPPPLRSRKADIPLLVRHFLEQYNNEYRRDLVLPPGSLDSLFRYEWPGNVRALRAAVRKAAAYADESSLVSAKLLQDSTRERGLKSLQHVVAFDPLIDTWRDFFNRARSAYFQSALLAANGNKEEAVRRSGISRSQFYEHLKEIDKRLNDSTKQQLGT
jgi:DNA-binding NtrC family response regulator